MKLIHFGIHDSLNKNSGDTLLFSSVRKVFDYEINNIDWDLRQLWDPISIKDIGYINKFDGIVIGGGGLFLVDQKGAKISNSGWQWNSSIEFLKGLEKPIFLYSVGFNRFRSQIDFPTIFSEHVNLLLEKSKFFGLRNTGSINAIANYVDKKNLKKISHQFCPTMSLCNLYPNLKTSKLSKKIKKKLVLNMAFDREELRFNGKKENVCNSIADTLSIIQRSKLWEIIVVAHKSQDFEILPYLEKKNITYKNINITNASSQEIIKFYSEIDFVIGMRGHSQMIPFGLRKPILSLISHDKMQFLLDDIKKDSWGIEILSENLKDFILDQLNQFIIHEKSWLEELNLLQQKVWIETIDNIKKIKSYL